MESSTSISDNKPNEDDEPLCLAWESQEPDSLSVVEASVLELYTSVCNEAMGTGDGLSYLGDKEPMVIGGDVRCGLHGGIREVPGKSTLEWMVGVAGGSLSELDETDGKFQHGVVRLWRDELVHCIISAWPNTCLFFSHACRWRKTGYRLTRK